jgi:transcriptional regulator with XRE-family HTH domain
MRVRDSRGRVVSQEEFGARIGVTRGSVSQWENNTSAPSIENLRSIARISRLSLDWLDSGKGEREIREEKPLPIGDKHKARVAGEVNAGVWREASPINIDADADADKYPPVPAAINSRIPASRQGALKVIGNSVNKAIPDGAFAICESLWDSSEPEAGDLVVVQRERNGLFEATIKLLAHKNGRWELQTHSHDPEFQGIIPLTDNFTASEKDSAIVQIIGRVIGHYAQYGNS